MNPFESTPKQAPQSGSNLLDKVTQAFRNFGASTKIFAIVKEAAGLHDSRLVPNSLDNQKGSLKLPDGTLEVSNRKGLNATFTFHPQDQSQMSERYVYNKAGEFDPSSSCKFRRDQNVTDLSAANMPLSKEDAAQFLDRVHQQVKGIQQQRQKADLAGTLIEMLPDGKGKEQFRQQLAKETKTD